MRLPRLRFTVRRLMAVVAVLALVLGVSVEMFRLKHRRDSLLNLAADHGRIEQAFREMEQTELEVAQLEESLLDRTRELQKRLDSRGFREREAREFDRGLIEWDERHAATARIQAAMFHKCASHHAALRQKYCAAAARPWRSIEPDPQYPDTPILSNFWRELGNFSLKAAIYREVLKRNPDHRLALNGLAWLLATSPDASLRDGKRAVELATKACQGSNWTEPAELDTLAAAYAEAGDFPNAVRLQREAIAKLPAGDPTRSGFLDRLLLYQSNQPYRMNGKTRM